MPWRSLTKNANHLTAAHLFDETNLFTATAAGTDTLSGKHVNTTIPKFIGALNRYRTLGAAEQSYLTAAEKFLPRAPPGGHRPTAHPGAGAASATTARPGTGPWCCCSLLACCSCGGAVSGPFDSPLPVRAHRLVMRGRREARPRRGCPRLAADR